jgi:hypothetical protein
MIKKRNIIALSLFIYIPCMVISASPRSSDNLLIVNRTRENIFIESGYLWKPQKNGVYWLYTQKINNIDVSTYLYSYAPVITLHSDRQMIFLSMAPTWFTGRYGLVDGRSPYDVLREIPMLERIKAVVKTLKITNGQGDVLFSLEDAREEDLVVERASWGGEGVPESLDYFLEIQGPR